MERLEELSKELLDVLSKKNELVELENKLKGEAIDLLKVLEEPTYKNDEIMLSYVKPSSSLVFDSTKFKKENPELFEDYKTKERNVKESVRVKVL